MRRRGLLLGHEEIDLVALVNAACDIDAPLRTPDVDADEYRFAEVLSPGAPW